jgi:hypothetical protein
MMHGTETNGIRGELNPNDSGLQVSPIVLKPALKARSGNVRLVTNDFGCPFGRRALPGDPVTFLQEKTVQPIALLNLSIDSLDSGAGSALADLPGAESMERATGE